MLGHTKEEYDKVRSCIHRVADMFGIETHDVLESLNKIDAYPNIREWYDEMSKQHKTRKIPKGTPDQKKATDQLEYMSVSTSGARSGETLLGVTPATKNAIIILTKGVIPPRTRDLDFMRHFPDIWGGWLNKLGTISFFRDLTISEREDWIEKHEVSEDVDMAEVEGSEIQILDIGKSKLNNLDKTLLSEAMSEQSIPIINVRNMFEGKTGSGGIRGRHTLMFYRSYWRVSDSHAGVPRHEGLVIDVESGSVIKFAEETSEHSIMVFDGVRSSASKTQKVGFKISKFHYSVSQLSKLILKMYPNRTQKDIDDIKFSTRTFTPAGYKSLMQKIVRFRPLYVDILGKNMDAEFVLVVTISLLMSMPGSFVPDIQRFVSGMESALKRLAVTIFEDGYTENMDAMLSLLAGAYIAQKNRQWMPSETYIVNVFKLAIATLQDSRAFVFDISSGSSISGLYVSTKNSAGQNASALLDELKSFQGDLHMVRYIVSKPIRTTSSDLRPKVMPIEHCIDQHWVPEVAYFYTIQTIEENTDMSSKPFSKLFIKLFSEVTGINPRRPSGRKGKTMHPTFYSEDFESRPFVIETRRSQNLLLVSRQAEQTPRKYDEDSFKLFKYELDRSWIAGMVGVLEIRGRPISMVTLNPSDPEQLVALRKPTRGIKNALLTDAQEEESIAKARIMLSKGISVKRPPLKKFKDTKVYLNEDGYYIGKNKWDVMRFGKLKIYILEPIQNEIYNALTTTGNGEDKGAYEMLHAFIKITPLRYVRRALMYMGTHSRSFEFNHISREGNGTKQAVVKEDVGAYQVMLQLSIMFSGAIRKEKGHTLRFVVPNSPFMWHVRDEISKILTASVSYDSKLWKTKESERILWPHQESSLTEMKTKHESGKKGHFLWMTVGLGKTSVVLEYVRYLLERNQLPKYIIYTLPESAMASVIHEIELYGFDIQVMVPLKNVVRKKYVKQGCDLAPYTFNLIEHDHLRRCSEMLTSNAPQSLFIIDEVHKALNETKRTSVALELSHLAEEFIALTGTPITDSNTYKLIWWLEQIVSFEVNEKNFWVAANGMVARKINTRVLVKRKEIVAPMTPQEDKEYRDLIPAGLGGRNPRSDRSAIIKAIDVCYSSCTREMIDIVKKTYSEGVMVVAKDKEHQQQLKQEIIRQTPLTDDDIFLIESKSSIFLTDDSVLSKETPNYKVVITTIRKSEGYTLTHLRHMVSSVYPSNNATREQLEGRINRIGQRAPSVTYYIVHNGILTYILTKHNNARTLSAVLQALAQEV